MEEKEDSSLLLFRRPTRVHIRNFGLPSLGTIDGTPSSKTFGIRYYFVYFVQIFENCRVGWKSRDLFKWTRCVFFSITVIVNGREKGGTRAVSRETN